MELVGVGAAVVSAEEIEAEVMSLWLSSAGGWEGRALGGGS